MIRYFYTKPEAQKTGTGTPLRGFVITLPQPASNMIVIQDCLIQKDFQMVWTGVQSVNFIHVATFLSTLIISGELYELDDNYELKLVTSMEEVF